MHITQTILLSLKFLWEACSDESGPKPHQAHLKVGFFWRTYQAQGQDHPQLVCLGLDPSPFSIFSL